MWFVLTTVRRSFTAPAILTIRVGKEPNHTDFMAHESFLTARSEFFRRAMDGNWKEAETSSGEITRRHTGHFRYLPQPGLYRTSRYDAKESRGTFEPR